MTWAGPLRESWGACQCGGAVKEPICVDFGASCPGPRRGVKQRHFAVLGLRALCSSLVCGRRQCQTGPRCPTTRSNRRERRTAPSTAPARSARPGARRSVSNPPQCRCPSWLRPCHSRHGVDARHVMEADEPDLFHDAYNLSHCWSSSGVAAVTRCNPITWFHLEHILLHKAVASRDQDA